VTRLFPVGGVWLTSGPEEELLGQSDSGDVINFIVRGRHLDLDESSISASSFQFSDDLQLLHIFKYCYLIKF
jgi:hypothetical protein